MNQKRILSVKLNQEQARRWAMVMDCIRSQSRGNVYDSEVVRELMELEDPRYITQAERDILRHGSVDSPLEEKSFEARKIRQQISKKKN